MEELESYLLSKIGVLNASEQVRIGELLEKAKKTVTDEEINNKYPITGALHGEEGLYKLTNNASRDGAKWMRDQLTKQDNICTDTGNICKYNCPGLCKERC